MLGPGWEATAHGPFRSQAGCLLAGVGRERGLLAFALYLCSQLFEDGGGQGGNHASPTYLISLVQEPQLKPGWATCVFLAPQRPPRGLS